MHLKNVTLNNSRIKNDKEIGKNKKTYSTIKLTLELLCLKPLTVQL